MYTELRPDYFPVTYSADSWNAVLRQLDQLPVKMTLCLKGQQFVTAGIIYTLWQKIKGLLGFTNLANPTLVSAQLIKFLFLGAAQGYIPQNQTLFESVKNKMISDHLKVHSVVKDVLKNIRNIASAKADLVNFYRDNQKTLKPSIWNCIYAKQINLKDGSFFGEIHLALAEKEMYAESPSAEASAVAIKHFYQAAQLYNSDDPRYTQQLRRSFDSLVSRSHVKPLDQGTFYLLLAERKYREGDLREAFRLFTSAWNGDIPFNPRQSVLFLHTAIQLKHFISAEKLSEVISLQLVDDSLKEMYAADMTSLGDYFSAKKATTTTNLLSKASFGWTPSSADHCRKALAFYEKANLTTSTNNSDIFRKILAAAEYLPEKDLLQIHSQSSNWNKIFHLLIIMKGKDLLKSVNRRKIISDFTREANHLISSTADEHSKKYLHWIEEALRCIGSVKEKLSLVSSSLLSSEKVIKSTLPDLLTGEGRFAFDVGAGLHFLRAEILQKQVGNKIEVLNAYKLAANLALKNPFGAGALFLEDQQETLASLIDAHIEAYRKCAIAWGANL